MSGDHNNGGGGMSLEKSPGENDVDDQGHADDEDGFWMPANYSKRKLDSAADEDTAWQLVKRPWKPTEEQKSRSQKAADKKKEKDRMENGIDEDDDEEPGTTEAEEKFHYYWRLSNPKEYIRAGAVGKSWRAVRFYEKAKSFDELNDAKNAGLHWIVEARWKEVCGGKGSLRQALHIHRSDFVDTGKTFDDLKLEASETRSKFKVVSDLVTKWAEDKGLQLEAQKASTDPKLLEGLGNNGEQELPFQHKDGTFVDSRGSLDACPAYSTANGKHVDRMYVKLRSAQVDKFGVGGGVDPGRHDVFILKTKLDWLAGMTSEDDPIRDVVDASKEELGWQSDPRRQGFDMYDAEEKKKSKEIRIHTDLGPGIQLDPEQEVGRRQDVSFWVRNAHGFAVKFTIRRGETGSWAVTRREAIRSIDTDRGWCRHIDPAIDLYLVPSSHDEPMQNHILAAMALLDMPMDRIEVKGQDPAETEKSAEFMGLHTSAKAKPECAATKIHLLFREQIPELATALRKLSMSPFRHYETWITKRDWEAYLTAHPARTLPGPGDLKRIQEARQKLEEKGKEAKVGEETRMIEEGKAVVKSNESKGNKTAGDKKEDSMLSIKVEIPKEPADTTTLVIHVSSAKLHNAVGTRGKAKGQAAVMGGSATTVAKHLGWQNYDQKTPAAPPLWPGTAHMPAEWLHRCAYSWGGIGGNPKSSQVPKNLVFGTGECNSVMTRYEKAWQDLVYREGDRIKAEKQKEDEDNRIRAEKKKKKKDEDDNPSSKAGRASLGSQNLGGGHLWCNVNRTQYRSEFGVSTAGKPLKDADLELQPMKEQVQKKELPPWLCFALDYQLDLVQKAKPLKAGTFKTEFYPWQRGFFTKFEQVLDEVVLEQAYRIYEELQMEEEETLLSSKNKGENSENRSSRKDAKKQKKDQLRDFRNSLNLPDWKESPHTTDQQPKGKNNDGKRPPEGDHDQSDITKTTGKSDTKKIKTGEQGLQGGVGAAPAHNDEPLSFQHRARRLQAFEPPGQEFTPKFQKNLAQSAMASGFDAEGFSSAEESSNDEGDNSGPPSWLQAIWEDVHAPGPTHIHGLVLTDAEIVMGSVADQGEAHTGFETATGHGAVAMPLEDGASEQQPPAITPVSESTQLRSESEVEAWRDVVEIPSADAPTSELTNLDAQLHVPEQDKQVAPSLALQICIPRREAIPTNKPAAEPIPPHQQQQESKPTAVDDNDDKPPRDKTPPVPPKFVVQGTFALFGRHKCTLATLQADPSTTQSLPAPAATSRPALPSPRPPGFLLPPLAASPLDALALNDTTFTYSSSGRHAGLSLHTTITLSGFLQPVNALLHDVLGQDRPRLDVSGRISTVPLPECLTRVPEPLAFVLTGELPDVSVELFGVLTVTHIGVEINGARMSSAGGYEVGYAFFGRGRIGAAVMGWRVNRFGGAWCIAVYTESMSWTNVAGVDGVDLKDVFLEASWLGTKIATARLELRATFSIKDQATLMLQGQLAKDDFEVAGYLEECTLATLKQLYNQRFNGDIDIHTDHEITISSMVLIMSKSSGVTLYGAVSVHSHSAAEALIHIKPGTIEFEGNLSSTISFGPVTVEQPRLAMAIHTSASAGGSGFLVRFAGKVSISDTHKAEVLVYLERKTQDNTKQLDYTIYGLYEGDLCLHDLLSVLGDTDLLRDVKMRRIAVCASSVDSPVTQIAGKPSSYAIGKGLALYGEVSLPVVSTLLGVEENKSFVVCALYRPPEQLGGGSKVDIGIRIPDQNLFKIGGFAVGNIALDVQVIDSLPSIKIGGDLSFPVENDQTLIMALGLSASVYEAAGEAVLKTDWVNPLNSKGVIIKDFKAGLGILYAGGAPSSITLGGAVMVGSVSGSVLVHTGVDPRKQLLQIKLRNLDVGALLNAIGGLIGLQLPGAGGSNAFFIRKLDVYLSSGVEVMGSYYPPGIRLDVDMTLFGKRATLYAEVQKDHVVLKGSVQKFKLGPLEVCAASNPAKDPSVDIELSSESTKQGVHVYVDGKVIFGQENWVMILVNIDTSSGTFNAHFELVIGDALSIKVDIKLEGGLPPPKQDRVNEIEDDAKSDTKQQSLPPPQPQPQPQQPQPSTDGGLLQGKTFTMNASVKQDIVNYLMEAANDHLGGERDPEELKKLEKAFEDAKTALKSAENSYKTAEAAALAAVEKVSQELDKQAADLRDKAAREQASTDAAVSKLDERERNLVLQAAQDERDLAEKEAHAVAEAEAAARQAHAELEAWRGRVQALHAANAAEQDATAAREAAEMKLADARAAMLRHEQTRPGVTDAKDNDPAFKPWQWQHEVLEKAVGPLETSWAEAVGHGQAAKQGVTALSMGTEEEAEARLVLLASAASGADSAAVTRRAAVAVNIEAGKTAAKKKREDLQKSRATLLAHARKTIDNLKAKQTALERDRADQLAAAKTKNDPLRTDAGKAYELAVQTHRAADVKLRAYRDLKNSISGVGAVLLTPLRFAVNVLGQGLKKLLNLKSIELSGSISDTSGKVNAAVSCTVGGYDWDWTLEIDISDIVSFFSKLWGKIKSVIVNVADKLLELAKKGLEAVKDFCDKIGTEARRIAEDAKRTAEHFVADLARVVDQVQHFMTDIDKNVLQPFIHAGEVILRDVSIGLDRVGEALQGAAVDLVRDVDNVRKQADGVAHEVIQTIDQSLNSAVRDISSAFGIVNREFPLAGLGPVEALASAFGIFAVAAPAPTPAGPSDHDLRRMRDKLDEEGKHLRGEWEEVEKERRQNREKNPIGEERDRIEAELAMRRRKVDISGLQLELKDYQLRLFEVLSHLTEPLMLEEMKALRGIGENITEIARQLQLSQLKVMVRVMRNEGRPLDAQMKRVALDIELEELRGTLMEGREEIEGMRRQGEQPEKMKKAMEYLNKVLANFEKKTVELKGL